MGMTTLEKLNMNVNQANSDFQAIKDKILEKGVAIADGTQTAEYSSKIDEVYEKGLANAPNLLEYATNISSLYYGARFPANSKISLITPNANNLNYLFYNALGLVEITLGGISDGRKLECQNTFRDTTNLVTIDLTDFKIKLGNAFQMFRRTTALKIKGELDFSESTNVNSMFTYCYELKDIEIAKETIKLSITFEYSSELTKASITSIINGLSTTVTDQTLTLSKTAVDIAFEENYGENNPNNRPGSDTREWDDLIATKQNWTINLV